MDQPAATASPLGGCTVHDLYSSPVDDTFRIFVGTAGADPTHVLVLTDGNGLFGTALDTVRLMRLPHLIPSMLVVGIGYPEAETLGDTVEIRARDLTPTAVPHVFARSGGADAFLAFIRDELRPWLAEHHAGAGPDADFTYFGHSLGGLFGTHTLFTDPTLFDRWILSSASLWWDHELMFRVEAENGDVLAPVSTRIHMGIGGLETDDGRRREGANLPDDHGAKPVAAHLDMVEAARRFVDQLRGRHHRGVELTFEVIPDEFHTTVPTTVLSRGLRHLFDAP